MQLNMQLNIQRVSTCNCQVYYACSIMLGTRKMNSKTLPIDVIGSVIKFFAKMCNSAIIISRDHKV